jgi:hypothetical protein
MSKRNKSQRVWYMCLNPYSQTPPLVRHESLLAAQLEALRLSREGGQKCHVLKLIGTAYPPLDVSTWVPREDAE